MNLIEARKLADEGWVRSPTRTEGKWAKPLGSVWIVHGSEIFPIVRSEDLDAEDWEPKPAPRKLFEAEVMIDDRGTGIFWSPDTMGIASECPAGWRKIRVREVAE